MKNKVVNRILAILFNGKQDEEDMTYIQVKFALEVLLNNLGKLAVVFCIFFIDRHVGGNRNDFPFIYLYSQICLRSPFRF